VASDFEFARWRSERRGCTGASDWWQLQWQAHRRSPDGLTWVTTVWLKCRGTWRKAARCLTLARVDPKRPWAKRTRRAEWTVAGVHPLGDISYSLCVVQPRRARITAAGANPGAWSPAVSSLSWWSNLVTVPSKPWFRVTDMPDCSAQSTNFCATNCLYIYSKFVALHTSYNSAIATTLNRAIDLTQIHPKSLTNAIGALNSVSRVTDSTTLNLFFSKLCMGQGLVT
jgi:hypothetical protein